VKQWLSLRHKTAWSPSRRANASPRSCALPPTRRQIEALEDDIDRQRRGLVAKPANRHARANRSDCRTPTDARRIHYRSDAALDAPHKLLQAPSPGRTLSYAQTDCVWLPSMMGLVSHDGSEGVYAADLQHPPGARVGGSDPYVLTRAGQSPLRLARPSRAFQRRGIGRESRRLARHRNAGGRDG
jgi:hypothetical protein